MNDVLHVIPLNDLYEHAECEDCWCDPEVSDRIVIHNSADRREDYETGKRKKH